MSNKNVWNLYYHREKSRPLAEFLRDLTDLSKKENQLKIIALPNLNSQVAFSKLPKSVRDLLYLGHQDVILTFDDRKNPENVVFACEITDAKPAKDHWMQRFPSLVGACKQNVPSVFVMPFEMKTSTWTGSLKSEFFYAFDRVMDIYQIPIYLANWEQNKAGNLEIDTKYTDVPDRNSESMKDVIRLVNMTMNYASHGRDFKNLLKERIVVNLRDKMKIEIKNTPKPTDYAGLKIYESVAYMKWNDVEKHLKTIIKKLPDIPERIIRRDKSLIFVPRPQSVKGNRQLKETLHNRIVKRNGNPYNGMPLAFDFMFCRLGSTPYERDVNLILDLSELSFSEFADFAKKTHDKSPLAEKTVPKPEQAPRYSLHVTQGYTHEIKDFIRQYCYAADLIILKDFILPFY